MLAHTVIIVILILHAIQQLSVLQVQLFVFILSSGTLIHIAMCADINSTFRGFFWEVTIKKIKIGKSCIRLEISDKIKVHTLVSPDRIICRILSVFVTQYTIQCNIFSVLLSVQPQFYQFLTEGRDRLVYFFKPCLKQFTPHLRSFTIN